MIQDACVQRRVQIERTADTRYVCQPNPPILNLSAVATVQVGMAQTATMSRRSPRPGRTVEMGYVQIEAVGEEGG